MTTNARVPITIPTIEPTPKPEERLPGLGRFPKTKSTYQKQLFPIHIAFKYSTLYFDQLLNCINYEI